MQQILTNFRAETHGFKFVNRFELSVPSTIPLPIFGQVDVKNVVYGLCGGMCFGALDYFYAGKEVPGYIQPEDLPLGDELYLWGRQIDSLIPFTLPKVIEWVMRDDADVAARCARFEVPKLRRALDRGKPTVLALIREKHLETATENHQVLALGYDFDDATRQMKIYLYEPNHPGMTPTLDLNVASPAGGLQLSQSTGEPLRGFFVIDYRAEQPPA